MSESEAGPSKASSIPDRMMENGDRSRSTSVAESTEPIGEGKGKEVDHKKKQRIALSDIITSSPSSSTQQSSGGLPTPPWSSITPKPMSRQGSSETSLGKRPAPPLTIAHLDSSDLDRVSPAPIPSGKPMPELSQAVKQEQQEQLLPPAKRSKLSTPTVPSLPPLPTGPPTVQHLRVLLQPEHVDLNRPKKLFDYVRPRDTKGPMVKLSPSDLKEILEKMRKVDDIWLRTMGEEDVCLQCLAMWLKWFINSPKAFEGCMVPLLWVILKAKPSNDKIKSAKLILLAKQALEKAKQNNLERTPEIQTLVDHFDKLVEKGRQARAAANATPASSSTGVGAGTSTGDNAAPKKILPSFKKTPNVNGGTSSVPAAGSSNTSTSSSTPTARPPPNPTSTSTSTTTAGPPRPPAVPIVTPKQLSDLEKILAASTAASVAKERAANGPQYTNTRPPPPSGLSYSNTNMNANPNPNARPSSSTSASGSGFRSVPGPTPMMTNRASASGPGPASGSGQHTEPTYPSPNNRTSVFASEEARFRAKPTPYTKPLNWRNSTVQYRDHAIAEAREFVQDDVEADEPYWWKYRTEFSDPHGHSTMELDQAEGHTMRDLTHAERTIEWYTPLPYECTGSTVHIVNTPETEVQDARERGQLSTTYYPTLREVPLTPSEVGTRIVEFNPYAGSKWMMAPPPVFIPSILPPQPAFNPYAWPPQQQQQQHQHQYQHQGYAQPNPTNPYQSQSQSQPNSIPSPYGSGTSSAYRPRNAAGAGGASPASASAPATGPGTSSAYRPRATSAPAPASTQPPNEMKPEYDRRASTPSGTSQQPKQYNHLHSSGNRPPIPDRERINHTWKKDIRPKKSALHNPLTPKELAESLEALNNAPPVDFSKYNLEDDDEDDHDGLKSGSNSSSDTGPWRDMSRGPASKQ